jgi:hypothetical protein
MVQFAKLNPQQRVRLIVQNRLDRLVVNKYGSSGIPSDMLRVIPACLPAVIVEGPESFRWLFRMIPAALHLRE